MGDAKRKSRKREEILAAELRCIYCLNPAQTAEHMPPRGMFRDRDRPSGMEYGACEACNSGTRGADAVATFIALQHPHHREDSWQARKIRSLISTIDIHAPGVREELTQSDKFRHKFLRRANSSLLQPVVHVRADGPLIKAYLGAFGAKLGMALFREHVGFALPINGAVWCQFNLNAGMTQENLEARAKVLPIFATLEQGRKSVKNQFVYRYNCDGRTVLSAVVEFHRNLWFTLFASSDEQIIALFRKPDFLSLPGSIMTSPGNLVSLIQGIDQRAQQPAYRTRARSALRIMR